MMSKHQFGFQKDEDFSFFNFLYFNSSNRETVLLTRQLFTLAGPQVRVYKRAQIVLLLEP